MAKKPGAIDPSATYRITLNKLARHGTTVLRPKDDICVKGSEIDKIAPPDAVESAEKL